MAIPVESSERSNATQQKTIYEQIKDHQRRLNILERASRLRSASIGGGGLTVYDEGSITLEGGGDIQINDGGNVEVNDGGNVTVNDGGDVEVNDQGNINLNDGGDLFVYGPTGALEAKIGDGKAEFYDGGQRTAVIGEYAGTVWEGTANVSGTLRGLALFDPVESDLPYFQAAHMVSNVGGIQGKNFVQIGNVPFASTAPHVDFMTLRADAVAVTEGDEGAVVLVANGDVDLQMEPSDGRLLFTDLKTSAGSANLTINSTTGVVTRSTSSLRYKQDIEDAVIDPADVLQLQGRTWRDKNEVEQDPDTEQRYVGFIAEELDALPTMRQFVNYDDQGPESIYYDRLTVALLALAKDQQTKIEALENQTTEPTPDPRVEDLLTAVAVLQDQNAALATRLSALEDQPEVDVLAEVAAGPDVTVSPDGGKVGFFGEIPVGKGAALTAAAPSGVDVVSVLGISVLGGNTAATVNNHTTRINEIEARLKSYGLIA